MGNKLITVMPHNIHEAPFNMLQVELWHAIHLIPLNFNNWRNEIAVELHTNARVDGLTISAYLDVQIRICSLSDHPCLSQPQPYLFLKCTFSQTASDVNQKLRAYVKSFPLAITVVKITVKESPTYRSPNDNSGLARQLAGRSVMPWDRWKPARTSANALGPVITHGITWIDLSVIEVHIWIWTRRNPINVMSTSTTDMQEYAISVSQFCCFLRHTVITDIQ